MSDCFQKCGHVTIVIIQAAKETTQNSLYKGYTFGSIFLKRISLKGINYIQNYIMLDKKIEHSNICLVYQHQNMSQIQKAFKEGYFQIIILCILIGSSHFSILKLMLTKLITLEISLRQIDQFANSNLLNFFLRMFCLSFVLFHFMTTCFPLNNFFERALFSMMLVMGLFYDSEQASIVNYLTFCISLQIVIIGLLVKLNWKNKIYYFILIFNCLAAGFSIHLGLHSSLVNSPNLGNVLIYGSLGIVLTVMLSLSVKYSNIPNIYVRKIFHIPPLILFPIFDHKFPDIFQTALIGIIYIFVILELLRYFSRQNQNGILLNQFEIIWEFMGKFIDKRDKYLWITHISLLIGMSISYFLSTYSIIKHSSVILPIGDAFAAIIGTKFGRIKVGKKSIQGSIAFIVTCFIMFWACGFIVGQNIDYWRLSISIILTSVVELLSVQVDNLLLPLFFSYLYFCI